ncbi:hypothetical protein TRUGW13939_07920 [Talaromyces rugulosus]|uniref:Uncharacterized protein n=1 Tax=Talaromyces rugulosus TaxID=121627 RepID=A0A7H8R309_TALRU|nr:hypothetical protein TRUGW13939_07920 [Talaromyces rugulosus]
MAMQNDSPTIII